MSGVSTRFTSVTFLFDPMDGHDLGVVSFGFHRWVFFSFPLQSPWENERPVSLGSPVERANFSIPWRWSAIIELRETSQTQDIKSRLRSQTSDSRFDSLPRMVHYPIVIEVGHRAKSLAANKFGTIAKRPINIVGTNSSMVSSFHRIETNTRRSN